MTKKCMLAHINKGEFVMKEKSKKLTKIGKIWMTIVSAACVLTLVFGLTFGLGNFFDKLPENEEDSIGGPTNSTFWDADISQVDTDWEGNGTQNDPWLISSAEELAGLAYTISQNTASANDKYAEGDATYFYSGKYFKLTNDVDLSKYYWRPIGVQGKNTSFGQSAVTPCYFSGMFDGDYHMITGMFASNSDISGSGYMNGVGLFGSVSGYFLPSGDVISTTIENIKLDKSESANGQGYYTGGIIGFASSLTNVLNCSSNAQVGAGACVGGIVGGGSATLTVKNCYNSGNVTNLGPNGGGIIGMVGAACTIENCYNTGTIDSSNGGGGGLVGNSGIVYMKNSYNFGTLRYYSTAGGLVGTCSTGSITNSYNIGSLVNGSASTATNIGQLIGSVALSITLSKVYYKSGTAIGSGTGSAIAKSDLATVAKNKSFYTTQSNWDSSSPWDFDNVWAIDGSLNDGYPVFIWQVPITKWTQVADMSYETLNEGTEANPYIIDTPEKLAGIAKYVNSGYEISKNTTYAGKYFKQTANIRLGQYDWEAIGYFGMYSYFAGTYDGNGYKISGLHVNTSKLFQGLFGVLGGGGIIKNVTLENSEIIATGGYTGAIVGWCDNRNTVKNCRVMSTVSITGGGSHIGGIVGASGPGGIQEISNCENYASIKQTSNAAIYVGGISGMVQGSVNVINCVNYGNVTSAGDYVGGIYGYTPGGKVENCVNHGNITGKNHVGGISGGDSVDTTITNCINNGIITGIEFVGGIVGNMGRCKIINCISSGNLIGDKYVGGIAGTQPIGIRSDPTENPKSTGEIKNCLATGFIKYNGDDLAFAGTLVGYVQDSVSGFIVTNCAFYGSSNKDLGMFAKATASAMTFDSCYSDCQRVKQYSSGDFAGFGIVDGLNDGYPVQKELFWAAEFAPALDVASYFAGWTKI